MQRRPIAEDLATEKENKTSLREQEETFSFDPSGSNSDDIPEKCKNQPCLDMDKHE